MAETTDKKDEALEKMWDEMRITPEEQEAMDQAVRMVFGSIDEKSPRRWWHRLKFWK